MFRFLSFVALAGRLAAAQGDGGLAADDECLAAGSGAAEECSLNALQRRGQKVAARKQEEKSEQAVAGNSQCGSLHSRENRECSKPVEWIANHGGKYDPHANSWFMDMPLVTGMSHTNGTLEDFQRMYFCSPPGGKACGLPPCSCSKPPCDSCLGGAPPKKMRAGCDADSTSVECVPPKSPMGYKGATWPTLTYEGTEPMHIFAVGDWGGLDGTLNPVENRPNLVAYASGVKQGPSPMIRNRWNKAHSYELCSGKDFVNCFNAHGDQPKCPKSCGFIADVDEQPQLLVARAMETRALKNKPSYILNVGDNFYWGGIEKTCGTPMDQISFTANHQFNQIFEGVYSGPGLGNAPWLSVLGNHDWGGRVFNNGWDQQIAYTWASTRWVMPAAYYMVHIDYPSQMFSADIYMVDTNFLDAHSPEKDSEHNICGQAHNPPGADCGAIGGPASVMSCPSWFYNLWAEQKVWLESQLSKSSSTWQIVVTHFPCGQDGERQGFYRKLRTRYGLDLLVTGHRHDQELWKATDTHRNYMGGLTCIVTGGGGGISSEATPDPHNKRDWFGEAQYGFFDITITKDMMTVESINWDGTVARSTQVYPSR